MAGILVLLVLALPVTQINLGAQDNGQMPTSTTIRQSYDALTKGFGVGYNGPLLVAVDVKPPAQNDQKSLNQLNAQEQQQQQQAQQQIEQLTEQYTEQLVDEGVPQDEAQEQAQQEATAAGRGTGPEPVTAAADPAAEGVPEVTGVRSAAGEAAEQDLEGARRRRGLGGRS